jgi:hypothetical protein
MWNPDVTSRPPKSPALSLSQRLGVSLGIWLLSAAAAYAQPPSASIHNNAATYRISGKVVDAHSGAALARCSVQIADVKFRSQSQTTLTASDGSFAFNGLPLGKYSLTAQRRGYLEQSYEEHEQFSTAIAVGPGLVSEGLLFKIVPEGVIAGTITDEAGEPIRGAQVRLFEDQDANGVRTTQMHHSVVTDDRGVYEFSELRPGAYYVVATARPWYSQRLQRFNSEEGAQNQALDLAYPTTFYPGVTDQDSAAPIPVKGGERIQADLTMAAQPALRLHLAASPGPSGQDDARNQGVSLSLSQSIFGQTEVLPTQVTMRPDGSSDIEGVLPGHYEVTMNRFGPGERGANAKHFEADVSGGTTELSEDQGAAEITVTGKVLSLTGKLPPRAGVLLRVARGRSQEYAALNEAGEFTAHLQPGTWEVVGNIEDMYIAGIKAQGATIAGRMLTVKPDDAPKLEIVAARGHAEIEGTALRGDKPASAVMVLLAPEDPKNNEILFRRDQSDSDGTFDLPNVVPGKYRLLAIERGWDLEWANPAVLQAFLAKSVPIEVKSGDHPKDAVVQVQER